MRVLALQRTRHRLLAGATLVAALRSVGKGAADPPEAVLLPELLHISIVVSLFYPATHFDLIIGCGTLWRRWQARLVVWRRGSVETGSCVAGAKLG
jgi:hypothetical protein